MADINDKLEIPSEGIETPSGFLYHPPRLSKQIFFLIISFFTAIFLGWIISSIPGDLSEFGKGIIYFIYFLILMIGYSVWAGILSALIFKSIKIPLIKLVFNYFIRKEKSVPLSRILPEREKVIGLMVRAQKTTKVFFIFSWIIGIPGGIAAAFFTSSMSSILIFILVLASSIAYGYFLFYFGRRGYIPFPDD